MLPHTLAVYIQGDNVILLLGSKRAISMSPNFIQYQMDTERAAYEKYRNAELKPHHDWTENVATAVVIDLADNAYLP